MGLLMGVVLTLAFVRGMPMPAASAVEPGAQVAYKTHAGYNVTKNLILKLRKSNNTAFANTTKLSEAVYKDATGPSPQPWDTFFTYEDSTRKSMRIRVVPQALPAGYAGIGSITVSISETGIPPFTPATEIAVDRSIFPLCPVDPVAGHPPYGGKGLPYAGELDAAPPPEEQGVAVPLQGD
jgi:hypothetical protein